MVLTIITTVVVSTLAPLISRLRSVKEKSKLIAEEQITRTIRRSWSINLSVFLNISFLLFLSFINFFS